MSDAPVITRQLNATDAPLVAHLHTESWRSAYRGVLLDSYLDGDLLAEREATWAAKLGDGAGVGWLAEAGGAPVGFVFVRPAGDATWGTWIDNLHVRPAVKGRGIGRQLLQAVAAWAADVAPERGLWLWVYAQNAAARGFYGRVGGREVERTDMPSPDGRLLPECRVVWRSPEALAEGLRTGL